MIESLTCGNLFNGLNFEGPKRIDIDGGVVIAITDVSGKTDFPYLAPGLVDIQMNGFGAYDVASLDDTNAPLLDDQLASLGTTSWMATVVTAPLERLTKSIERIDHLIARQLIPGCVGIHIEGPFLGDAPGAHNPKWIIPFDKDWIAALPKSVRMITVAAEQPNISHVMGLLRAQDIVVSIGHSRPTRGQFDSAVDSGATLVTHLFNGMSGVHHRDGGLALWALTDPRVRTGLISDLVHVNPESIALSFKAKTADGVCLVSDSVAWETERSRSSGVEIVDGAPRLPDGTIAGSSTDLASCVRNVITACRVDMGSAIRAATSTPAATVGLVDRGHIKVGGRADIIALDSDAHVLQTWRRLPFGRDQQTDA